MSEEFDNVLHTLERTFRKNLTQVRMDVTDLDIRVVATETFAEEARLAADNAQNIATNIFHTMQDSFIGIERSRDSIHASVNREIKDVAARIDFIDQV